MSSSPSNESEFQVVKKNREDDLHASLKEGLTQLIVQHAVVPAEGLDLMADAAFGIDRKAITVKVLREIADDLETNYRVPRR